MAKTIGTSSKGFRLLATIVAAVALACAGTYFVYFDTYRSATVQEGVLYRDGVRNTRELANMLRTVKPRTVVCLVTDEEVADPRKGDFQGEFELLAAKGIRLERVPVKVGGPPTPEAIDRFIEIVRENENQPVVVHCAQGVVRTGMMVAAFQDRVLGYDKQKALESVNIFGKSERRGARVRWFIEGYYADKAGRGEAAGTQPVALAPLGDKE